MNSGWFVLGFTEVHILLKYCPLIGLNSYELLIIYGLQYDIQMGETFYFDSIASKPSNLMNSIFK